MQLSRNKTDNDTQYHAAVTAPHKSAAAAGERILQQGGNAIEACVAMASALTVVYPHMTSLGGDGFWMIHKPGEAPIALNAAGKSALELGQCEFGAHLRGPKIALTTAGAVSGWKEALQRFKGSLSLDKIFEPAILLAESGFEVTETLKAGIEKLHTDYPSSNFTQVFMPNGVVPSVGEKLCLPALAQTYRRLASDGLQSWLDGELAKENAHFLKEQGSPIRFQDLCDTRAAWQTPLSISTQWGAFFNLAAPTQGSASLSIVALLDKYISAKSVSQSHSQSATGEEELLHLLIESVKQAFDWRNQHLADSDACREMQHQQLSDAVLNGQLTSITDKAAPWPSPGPIGDTVWMGVVDSEGLAVSYIQSIYWEFGSGLVNPATGVVWNNRSLGFNVDQTHPNAIAPNKQPMHTLNPPMALLNDGSRLIYGTMGGEGQPQTQAAIIWRHLVQGQPLEEAISAPRWLLGKTWGKSEDNLKLEQPLFDLYGTHLINRGHDAVAAPALAEFFGHAGAIHVSDTVTRCSSDPRSDGAGILVSQLLQGNS
ncbi:gamma-glutamyltransferase family protein [Vibrio ulleungensis]|uniref:Gamma-glutamyltransferase n=1 Tax=Vibrio ulleungensis TaxID=2807619 RepID=A0ABS2HIY6_9VIBR|nr:gamma-glutamyltransferase [Vibrio ulleungensis]MBM7036029.1 gamma-glutamyltransferase [Vibrio ulleungensis]